MTAGKIGFVKKYSDVMIAVGIVTIVVMMIIPLPTILLDLLLCMNITLALVVVMSAIYNVEALDLSVFPSLLLITTLFRLALNVSSTRLILLEGYAFIRHTEKQILLIVVNFSDNGITTGISLSKHLFDTIQTAEVKDIEALSHTR